MSGIHAAMATPPLRSLDRALELLDLIVQSGETHSIGHLARQLAMPHSTAYRIAATFERAGLLTRLRRGCYLPGPGLLRLARHDTLHRVLRGVSRPIVDQLSRDTGCTAHLGIFEDGMVTYLVKAGRSARRIFSREGTQLEPYCTAIGKVLLAALSESARGEYLRAGPFVQMTPNTLTDPQKLRNALTKIRTQEYATDNAEMDSDLFCLAVPVRINEGAIVAALSISTRRPEKNLLTHLDALRLAASGLGSRLAPRNRH